MKFLWKLIQKDTDFYFFEPQDLPNLGFQSVYAIPDEEADRLVEAGSYADYKGPVYSGDALYLDCDDEFSLNRALKVLKDKGLYFEHWDTGNRGGHIKIHRFITAGALSTEVPATDRSWVAENTPWVDMKLYTKLHLLRRPGALHEKTLKPKVIKSINSGNALNLSLKAETAPKPFAGGMVSVFEGNDIMNLSVPYFEGEARRQRLGRLAIEIFKRGQSFEFTHQWLVNVNLLGAPIEEEDLFRLVQWAMGEVHGSQAIRRSGK